MSALDRKPGGASLIDDAAKDRDRGRQAGKQTLTEGVSGAASGGLAQHQNSSRQAADAEVDSQVMTAPGTTSAEKGGPGAAAGGAGGADAAQHAAKATGGTPLPNDVRAKMEQKLHADFSGVRIHADDKTEQHGAAISAPAYTIGQNIFFRAGFGVRDEAILAHELVHVVQQGGAQPSGEAKVGGRRDAAESEAENVASAVTGGGEAPAISTGHDASTVRRFGAGFNEDGHGSIEKEAAGDSGNSKGLKEMYSGNFMRDMNQLNVPKVIDGLQGLPKDVANPKGDKIGGKGAIEITTAVIKAMAILELGPAIANDLISKGAIGAYRPEEHIDNPMGTGAADTIVTNTDPSHKKGANKDQPVGVGEPRTADGTVATKMVDKAPESNLDKLKTGIGLGDKQEVVASPTPTVDADRDRELKGSAFQGNQVENPKLYEVSPGGLGNHIYNSNESVKGRWLKASQLGSSGVGRSEFGAGSHAVEDYFSHSNFIEVALNSYISQALASTKKEDAGAKSFANKVKENNKTAFRGNEMVTDQHYFVDTLFDAPVPTKGGGKPKVSGAKPRQAITTGSFGGDDTKVSIAHVLLPSMPKLQNAILKTVDRAFGIAATDGDGGWEKIKAKLIGDKDGSAGVTLLEGFDHAGMVAPVPDLKLTWKTFPITPGLFGDPVTVSLPSGIEHISQSVPISAAFGTYAGIYKKAKDLVALVNQYAAYAKKLMIPLDWLVDAINEEVKKVEQMARQAIKAQVTAGLVSVIDAVSQRSAADKEKAKASHAKTGNSNDEFKRDVGDALDYLHDSVEDTEHETSLETRLKSGDLSEMPKAKVEALVGPVTVVKTEPGKDGKVRTYYKAVNPLPPSHSEIAKDHGPHAEVDHHHAEGEKPGNEAGSPFFSLARPLAVEAVRHCDAQMQAVWAQRAGGGDKSLFGDGKDYKFQSGVDGDSTKIHDGVLADSDKNAKEERTRASEEGRSYLQATKAEEIKKMPGVEQLLNLVDFFIAHPDANPWWKAIIDKEVASNPEPIYASILRRNRTRTNRDLKDPK